MRAYGVNAAQAVGNEFGLSGQYVTDLFTADRERRGVKTKSHLTGDQRIWAIHHLRTGTNINIVASTLGVSKSYIYQILRVERRKTTSNKPSISPPVSVVEDTEKETEEDPELEDFSTEMEEFCF